MNKNSVSLLALALATVFAGAANAATTPVTDLDVNATLTSGCEVTGAPVIDFGPLTALASTADKQADSGTGFQVACSASATPTIYADGAHSMVGSNGSIPFNLSLSSGASVDDFPVAAAPGSFTLTKDGALHAVTIYGLVKAADYKSLDSGDYTTTLTVAVVY